MSAPKLNQQLCFALYSASNTVTNLYRPLLAKLDLTYPQFVVMMCLWEQDNVAISEICSRTMLNKATLTPLLKRLEEKQFIIREVLKSNERQKNIRLTEDGINLALAANDVSHQVYCNTGLTEEQVKQIIQLSQLITAEPHDRNTAVN